MLEQATADIAPSKHGWHPIHTHDNPVPSFNDGRSMHDQQELTTVLPSHGTTATETDTEELVDRRVPLMLRRLQDYNKSGRNDTVARDNTCRLRTR